MERITIPGHRYYDDEFMDSGVAKLFNRLAASEDPGLEPEEINDMAIEVATLKTIESMYDGLGNPDHLRDLLQAERAGRLVVLKGGEG